MQSQGCLNGARSYPELMGSLKLGNVWVLVQLLHRQTRTKNQLYKNPNITKLETSYQLCSYLFLLPAAKPSVAIRGGRINRFSDEGKRSLDVENAAVPMSRGTERQDEDGGGEQLSIKVGYLAEHFVVAYL